MAFGIYNEIRYKVVFRKDKNARIESALVSGFQIGRFAFRLVPDTGHQPPNVGALFNLEAPFYNIDHIPTGYSLISVRTAEEAARIADDLSRFSKKDPASKDPIRAKEQFGSKISKWMKSQRENVLAGQPLQGYREFYAAEQHGR